MALDEELQSSTENLWLEITLPDARAEALAHPVGQKEIHAFCTNLMPSALLWVGGQFDPATLSVCHERGIPVIVVDAGIAMLPRMSRGWFPGKTRSLLSKLHKVLARTKEAADGLIRAGVSSDVIHITGSLEETCDMLNWDEDERYSLAQQIGPRPIWLAADIDKSEAAHIATAHRQASLRAHRLLCMVTTSHDAETLANQFVDARLKVKIDNGDLNFDETIQVFVTNNKENHGLWTRLSPITFLGGSHTTGARLDPFQVAAVGSVVVHGRQKGAYTAHFDRLMAANATFVNDRFEELGPTVSHLLSAEKAAAFAAAGWDVISAGSEVINFIADVLRETTQSRTDKK